VSAHTPGPWRDDSMKFTGGWRCLVSAGIRVIDVCDPRNRKTDDQDAANARLIAAAPDLLEAAKQAIFGMDGGTDDALCHKGLMGRKDCAQCRRVDGLIAAIEKAEGK